MGRRRISKQKEHITRDILLNLLKAGATLAIAVTAPNALKMLSKLAKEQKEWEPYYPASIERTTMRLWRKGLVDVRETNDGYTVTISDRGKQEILKYDVETVEIPKQNPWDERWRLVFFDIPTGDDQLRSIFREKLQSMGFFQMQKSVYVHPYPCRKQIQFLREVYAIPHFVKLATVTYLENDEDLRRHFRLKLE